MRTRDPLFAYLRRPNRRRLARVVRAYYAFVWAAAHRASGNAEDAADICQDVFLKLLLEPPAAESVRSPSGYLASRVLARASALRRSAERQRLREAAATAERSPGGAEGAMVGEDEAELLRRRVGELPEDLRRVVELRFLAGLPVAETARELAITERAVHLRIEKALDLLRRRLAPLAPALLAGLGSSSDGEATALTAPSPPTKLLGRLLKIAEDGAALGSTAPTAMPAGVAVAGMKTALAVGGALIAAAIAAVLWSANRNEDGTSPRTLGGGATAIAAIEPATSETAPPSPAEPTKTPAVTTATSAGPPLEVLRGRVVDEDGAPVPAARLKFSSHFSPERVEQLKAKGYRNIPEGKYERLAESDGEANFEFRDLFPAHGYVRYEGGVEGLFEDGGAYAELHAGQPNWKEMVLPKLRRISGTIRDGGGNPLPGGAILFGSGTSLVDPEIRLRRANSTERHGVRVGLDGRYDTGFRVKARPKLSTYMHAWADGHASRERELRSEEFRGIEATADFELEPEMQVSVIASDADGKSVEGAEVGHASYGGPIPYPPALTDVLGQACLEHLPAEECPIRVAKEGYHAAEVNAAPGRSTDLLVTLFPLGPTVTARVVFRGELAARGRKRVEVHLSDADEEKVFGRATPMREWFDTRQLLFTAWPRGPGRYRVHYRHGTEELRSEPFEYTGREAVELELPIDCPLRPPSVSGSVVDAATGKPLAGVGVEAHFHERGMRPAVWLDSHVALHLGKDLDFYFPERPGRGESDTTDAEGRFVIQLPEGGPWTVAVRVRSKEVWFHEPESQRLWWSGEIELQVGKTENVVDQRIEVSPGGAIEGIVHGEDGAPRPGEIVAVYNGRGVIRCGGTSAEGRFRFERLPAGLYAVIPLGCGPGIGISARSGGSIDTDGLPAPEEFFDCSTPVRDGETTRRDVDLKRERLGAIEGQVMGTLPKEGHLLLGLLVAGRPRPFLPFGGDLRPEEKFQIEGLFPGRYRVWIQTRHEDEPRILASSEVDVRRASTALVTLTPVEPSPAVETAPPTPGENR